MNFFRENALNILFVLLLFVVVRLPFLSIPLMQKITYSFFFLSAFFVFLQLITYPKVFAHKSFTFLYIVWFTYLIYFILFDHSYEGMAYVLLKGVTFALIMMCIYYYNDKYMESFPNTIIKIGLFLLFIGVIFDTNIFKFRYDGILNNANTFGFLSSLIMGILILKEDFSKKKIILMIFLMFLILASGSRGAILGVLIALSLRRPTPRNIGFIVLVILLLLLMNIVASYYGIVSGLSRIEETGGSFTSRNMTNAYGLKTLMLSPWHGFGLDKYAYISAKVIPEQLKYILVPNPHNSYLGMFIQLGIPLALIILLSQIYYMGKAFFYTPKNRVILFLILFSAISGLYESHLYAIFSFEGLVFWISISIYMMYIYSNEKQSKETF